MITPENIIDKKEFKSSSSDNIYTTILYDNCFACTCPAGGRRTMCKHIKQIIEDNISTLINDFPDFYNKISVILSDNTDKEKKKELYKKLSFSNKEIADLSYINTLYQDVNIEDIKAQAEARAQKFINTTTNMKNKLEEAVKINLISFEEFNEATQYLKQSIKTISDM